MRNLLKSIFLVSILNILPGALQGQTMEMGDQSFPADRPEAYFQFIMPSGISISDLSRVVSIDSRKGDTIYVYASRKEFGNFKQLGITYKLLTAPSLLEKVKMATGTKGMQAWDAYPTYSQYVAMMKQFAADYPALCKLDSIGATVNGKGIYFVKISDNVNTDESEPEFMYSSTMHGDEVTGYVLMLQLIDYLLSNYGQDAQVTSLVNNMEIWINPLANPDGTYYTGDNTVSGATRYNANSIDLNRNYPDPMDGDHPDGEDWQPENIAMMNFMKVRHFSLSANLHGGAEVLNYPWDTWSRRHTDDNWFQYISKEYADTVHQYGSVSYLTDFTTGYVNGYDWYSISGGRQDYMTYFRHGREITFELSYSKMPSGSSLPTYWGYNYRSLLNYMQECMYGIHGKITDRDSGLPLKAKVEILGHDADSSEIYSDSTFGFYSRLIYAGTYNLRVTSPGYLGKVIAGITVINHQSSNLDIELCKPGENHFAPHLLNNFGEFIDTIPIELAGTIKEQVCFSLSDQDGDNPWIDTLYSFSGNIVTTSDPWDTCVSFVPKSDFAGFDTLQMVICDNVDSMLCDTVYVLALVHPTGIPSMHCDNLKIFPNPFAGELSIRLRENDASPVLFQLYDLTGRCVYEQTVSGQEQRITNLALNPGIYLVLVRKDQKLIYSGKVICIR